MIFHSIFHVEFPFLIIKIYRIHDIQKEKKNIQNICTHYNIRIRRMF